MKQYVIGEDLLKAIMEYLAGRPYREVAQAIEALSKLEQTKSENAQ